MVTRLGPNLHAFYGPAGGGSRVSNEEATEAALLLGFSSFASAPTFAFVAGGPVPDGGSISRTAKASMWTVPPSIPPEVLEPIRRQLGVAHGVLDIAVAEIGLQGAGVVALICQGEAAGVA
jgi:hypothetical protein